MSDTHIVELLMEYAVRHGAKDLNKLPGLWETKVDETWTIKCNGHDTEIDGVPPFCWYIEYNGWPAGVLSAFHGDGVLAAGEGGNEQSLRTALQS